MLIKSSQKNYTGQDLKEIQQPLDYKKTGRVNPYFDKFFGHKTKNPFHGTERDNNSKRVERIKIEKEYERYKPEMSFKEKQQYEKHITELKQKEIREK